NLPEDPQSSIVGDAKQRFETEMATLCLLWIFATGGILWCVRSAFGPSLVVDIPRLLGEPSRRMSEVRARVDGWSSPRASGEPQNNEYLDSSGQQESRSIRTPS